MVFLPRNHFQTINAFWGENHWAHRLRDCIRSMKLLLIIYQKYEEVPICLWEHYNFHHGKSFTIFESSSTLQADRRGFCRFCPSARRSFHVKRSLNWIYDLINIHYSWQFFWKKNFEVQFQSQKMTKHRKSSLVSTGSNTDYDAYFRTKRK